MNNFILSSLSFLGFEFFYILKNEFFQNELSIVFPYDALILLFVLFNLWGGYFLRNLPHDEVADFTNSEIVPMEGSLIPVYLGMYVISLSLGGLNVGTYIIGASLFALWVSLGRVTFFNPILCFYGYRFYQIKTNGNFPILLISKRKNLKVLGPTENLRRINSYTFLDDGTG